MYYFFIFTVILIATIISSIYPPAIFLFIISFFLFDWYMTRDKTRPRQPFVPDTFDTSEIEETFQEYTDLQIFLGKKRDYLKSPRWKEKKTQRYLDVDATCECCGKPIQGIYHAHHIRGYDKIPNESISDIRILHPECHEYQHFIHGYPETVEEYYEWDAPIIPRS